MIVGVVHYNCNGKTSPIHRYLPPFRDNHPLTVVEMPSSQPFGCCFRYINLHSGSLTISASGQVPLKSGVDIQCYNYTLTSPFNCTPGVAIGIFILTQLSAPYRTKPATICFSPSRL